MALTSVLDALKVSRGEKIDKKKAESRFFTLVFCTAAVPNLDTMTKTCSVSEKSKWDDSAIFEQRETKINIQKANRSYSCCYMRIYGVQKESDNPFRDNYYQINAHAINLQQKEATLFPKTRAIIV